MDCTLLLTVQSSECTHLKNIIIEKDDVKNLKISNIEHKVLRDFNPHDILGVCKVRKVKQMLVADFKLNDDAKGLYPAIGYMKEGKELRLLTVGLCSQKNLDETINPLLNGNRK